MQCFFDTVTDRLGNSLVGASVTVRQFPSGTLATLFTDPTGLTSQPNPITTDQNGTFQFSSANGTYSLTITSQQVGTLPTRYVSLFDSNTVGTVFYSSLFGVKGDGVTDSTQPMINAINAVNAAGGGILVHPQGVILISSGQLPIVSNVIHQGGGMDVTTIRLNKSAAGLFSNYPVFNVPISNIGWRDLTLDGNYNVNADPGNDNYQIGIYLNTVTDCEIRRVKFKNWWYVGNENYFSNTNISVRDCVFSHCGDKATIVAPSGTYYGVGFDGGAINCEAVGNWFENCGHDINAFADNNTNQGLLLQSNKSTGSKGYFVYSRQGNVGLRVLDNFVYQPGIGLINLFDDNAGHSGGYTKDVQVCRNVVVSPNQTAASAVVIIGITADSGVIVSDNVVTDVTHGSNVAGILLNISGVGGHTQTGTIVHDNNLEGTFPGNVAILNNGALNSSIRGNILNGDSTTNAAINVVSGSVSTEISGNTFLNYTTKISDSGTGTFGKDYLQTYTPVWTSSNGVPAIGNGTLTGKFVWDGNRCTVEIYLAYGSSTTGGNANNVWFFSLPVSPSSQLQYWIGSAKSLQGTGGTDYVGICQWESVNGLRLFSQQSGSVAATGWGVSFPAAPATNQLFYAKLEYLT